MKGVLASARWRRRFAWASVAAVAGGLVFVAVHFTGPAPEEEQVLTEPAVLPAEEPREVAFAGRERAGALVVAAEFVRTAVARRELASSWDLASPSLRSGQTRASWAKGDIPVVPFPVRRARWRLEYSYPDEVGLKVALFPPKGARVDAGVFDLTLRRYGGPPERRWLVESFTPSPVQSGRERQAFTDVLSLPRIDVARGRGEASSVWLIAPFGVLGAVLLALVALGVRAWLRSHRAYARYTSSSRPS